MVHNRHHVRVVLAGLRKRPRYVDGDPLKWGADHGMLRMSSPVVTCARLAGVQVALYVARPPGPVSTPLDLFLCPQSPKLASSDALVARFDEALAHVERYDYLQEVYFTVRAMEGPVQAKK